MRPIEMTSSLDSAAHERQAALLDEIALRCAGARLGSSPDTSIPDIAGWGPVGADLGAAVSARAASNAATTAALGRYFGSAAVALRSGAAAQLDADDGTGISGAGTSDAGT